MPILPKVIYKFNAIPIKSQWLFVEVEKSDKELISGLHGELLQFNNSNNNKKRDSKMGKGLDIFPEKMNKWQ